MTIELMLERHMLNRITLRTLKSDLKGVEETVLDSSPSAGERVQSSGISDVTGDKAIRLIQRTEALRQRIDDLNEVVQAVERGMGSLNGIEEEIIVRRYFRTEALSKISEDLQIPLRTIYRHLDRAKSKIRVFVEHLMSE